MRIVVGQVLKYKGQPWLIDRISAYEETRVTDIDSEALSQELSREGNTQYVTKVIEKFEAGDIITIKAERISLTQPGKNGCYIYTRFNAKKETYDGDQRSEESNQPAADSPVEGPGDGRVDGQGVREEGSSAAD